MKTTFWWRIVLVLFASAIVAIGIIYDRLICFPGGKGECPLDAVRVSIIYPICIFSRYLLVLSPFTFIVSDIVFRKWLWVAYAWIVTSGVLIAVSPEYSNGIFAMMNPTKELVAMGMSILFVPVSLGMFLWYSWRKPTA